MNILVTGGAGYIGSHAVLALLEAGHTVYVFDSFEKSKKEYILPFLDDGHIVAGTTLSKEDLAKVFSLAQFDAVMHFAAYIEVAESVENPERFYRNNVEGTVTLLQAMVEYKVPHFIFSSTAAVYGNPDSVPIPEDAAKRPESPYGESKLRAEAKIQELCNAGKLKATVLRYFNAAGADAAARVGERHQPETHIIPNLLAVAAGQREVSPIFGDDYPTPDGTTIRDFIHVTDLAAAHLLALEKQRGRETSFEVYNIATGTGHSIKEMIEAARRITEHPIPIDMKPRRPGDPAMLVADATKIQKALGFVAKHSDLDNILQTAWNWQQKLTKNS